MKHLFPLLSFATVLFGLNIQAQELSWQELNTPKNAPVLCLKSIDNQLYAGYGGIGLLRSKNAGLSWDTLNNGLKDRYISDLLAVSNKELYIATLQEGVFRSLNGGESWEAYNQGLDIVDYTFCLLQKGNQLYAGTSRGVFSATTKEGVWTRLRFPRTSASNQMVTCLYQSGNKLMAGSSKSLYLSEDDGKNWREIPKVTDYRITAITEYKGKLILGTSGNGIVETDLNLSTFSKSPEFLGQDTAKLITTMLVTSEGILLKGTNSKGIFQTDSTLNRGLVDYEIRTMVEHKNQLFAGTYRQGVVVFKDKEKLAPWAELAKSNLGNALQMNLSPNPSTQRVSIDFSLAGENPQTLSCVLLSSEGRQIKNLLRKEAYPPGQHRLELDVQRLPAGIYYCSMSNLEGTLKVTRQLLVNH